MDGTFRIWLETGFNIVYLIIIWVFILVMLRRWSNVDPKDRGMALAVLLAFIFLAIGDMGHVGFRVIAFGMGGLDATFNLFGNSIKLAPLGSIATAWTFTLFYVCLVFMWKMRFKKTFGPVAWVVLALAVIRSLIMLHPYNTWDSQKIEEPLYTLRNLPLIMIQVGTIYLMLRDAIPARDTTFKWIGILIIISLVCYAPVVVLITKYPNMGMLMIPKTIAYLCIAYISLRGIFSKQADACIIQEDL